MALRYQGTEPKVIVYNGNSNVEEVCIKNGANATPVYVWGKPFNCTCTVTVGSGAAGVDTTLSRLSSPYEGASEGNYVVTRKNGTSNTITVHKGDRVQISFMTDDTACEIVSANVYNKGKAVTTEIDAYMAYSDTFSVNGDVVCSVTTKKNGTWHTVWTGSTTYAAGIKTGTLTASDTLKTSYKYRITATCSGTTNTSSEETGSAILSWSGSDRFGNWTAELTVTPTNNSTTLNINKTGTHDGLGTSAVPAVTLTKVEAYY